MPKPRSLSSVSHWQIYVLRVLLEFPSWAFVMCRRRYFCSKTFTGKNLVNVIFALLCTTPMVLKLSRRSCMSTSTKQMWRLQVQSCRPKQTLGPWRLQLTSFLDCKVNITKMNVFVMFQKLIRILNLPLFVAVNGQTLAWNLLFLKEMSPTKHPGQSNLILFCTSKLSASTSPKNAMLFATRN